MHSRTLRILVTLGLGLPALAVAVHAQVPTICQKPQGNALLNISGLKFLGSMFNVVLDAPQNRGFFLAVDVPQKPPITIPFNWGTICLSKNLYPLATSRILSKTGQFVYPITIPTTTSTIGTEVYFQSVVEDPTRYLAVSNVAPLTVGGVSPVKKIFFEDFEIVHNPPKWFASNGLWEIGKLTTGVGPPRCFSGSRCAATILAKQYPAKGAKTTWESPLITLPKLDPTQPKQQIRVNYRMWFDTEENGPDFCTLKVSTNRGQTWTAVDGSPAVSGVNKAWTQCSADLSSFAGNNILLGFYFESNTCFRCGAFAGDGVYIDDVHVFVGTPVFQKPENWEQGIGFWWHSDNGLWQVGTPTVGPKLPGQGNSSKQCVGTLLHDNYPAFGANTRLISPPVTLPTTVVRNLVFKTWIATENNQDYGEVQVSTDRGKTWLTLPSPRITGQSPLWTTKRVALVDTATIKIQGKTILIAFNFVSTTCFRCGAFAGNGWYLDDILIQ